MTLAKQTLGFPTTSNPCTIVYADLPAEASQTVKILRRHYWQQKNRRQFKKKCKFIGTLKSTYVRLWLF